MQCPDVSNSKGEAGNCNQAVRFCIMGYQKPSAFKTVIDFTLKDGHVEQVNDRSKEIAKKRGKFKKKYEASDIIERVDDAFSLDMDIE